MKFNSLEDAIVCDAMLVFRGLHRDGFMAAGLEVEVPSIINASGRYLAELEMASRSALKVGNSELRMQFRWSTSADYREELLSFYECATEKQQRDWSRRHRDERFTRNWKRLEAGELRKDRLTMFVTLPLWRYGDAQKDQTPAGLQVMAQGLELGLQNFAGIVQRLGGVTRRLTESDLALEYANFLNPFDGAELDFIPELSMLENFLLSDGVGVESPDIGFYLGGAFHGLLMIKSLPQATCSGMMRAITGLPIRDFSVTVNISKLDTTAEIERAEEELKRLLHTIGHSPRARMISTAEMKRERIGRLMSGAVTPLRAQFIFRTWDRTKEGLHHKMAALKAGIARLQSAKPYEAAFPNSAVNYLRCSAPGWSWDRNTDFVHYIEDQNLANMLPISGSLGSSLARVEAVYDGALGELIGVSGFLGEAGSESPAHILVTGSTGSGKSLYLNDFLTQSDPYYGFTAIIDDGLSYEGVVGKLGGKTFVIELDGNLTFNYLDPQGPLGPEHLSDVVGILLAMCGDSGGAEIENRRSSILSTCADTFYRDRAADWMNGGRHEDVARDAMVFHEYRLSRGDHFGFAHWGEYCGWKVENPELSRAKLQAITGSNISEFLVDDDARNLVERLAFAFMTRSEMPTHTEFRNWLELEALSGGRDAEEVGRIATLLSPWTAAEGKYGAVFDGEGNVDFRGPIVHIELGRIPDSAPRMKSVAAYLVTNQIRNTILRRPRSERKRVIIEELGSFLAIPNGGQIVRDFYERMRKYSTTVTSVIQGLSDRIDQPVFASVIGNSRQGIFFKQSSPLEAEALAKAFRLPASAKETLLTLPEPSKDKGAYFLLCNNTGEFPRVTLGCNLVHEEMLAVAGSSGAEFDARKRAQTGVA